MRYCKRCVMPDTRPGIEIDAEGICSACRNYENRKDINWDERWQQLEELADKYRGCNGNSYDCVIAASSGKDSNYQIYVFKELLKMNPLVVSVNNFSWTETGKHNWNNMLEQYNVDAIVMSMSPKTTRLMFRKGLKKGIPTWLLDHSLYSYPVRMATKLKIPLLVYGENISYEYGGFDSKETYSAINQINNNVAKPIPLDEWIDDDLSIKDLACIEYPTNEEIKEIGLDPIYLSYFVSWSGYDNMVFARNRGFKTLDDTGEWKRDGFIEQYDQIDSVGYVVHSWFKFPKFGHFRVTDVASSWIREGRITREEAVNKVIEEDWKLDKRMLYDFLSYTKVDERDFWDIVDGYANLDIVEKRDGNWRLRDNVVEALKNGGEVIE